MPRGAAQLAGEMIDGCPAIKCAPEAFEFLHVERVTQSTMAVCNLERDGSGRVMEFVQLNQRITQREKTDSASARSLSQLFGSSHRDGAHGGRTQRAALACCNDARIDSVLTGITHAPVVSPNPITNREP